MKKTLWRGRGSGRSKPPSFRTYLVFLDPAPSHDSSLKPSFNHKILRTVLAHPISPASHKFRTSTSHPFLWSPTTHTPPELRFSQTASPLSSPTHNSLLKPHSCKRVPCWCLLKSDVHLIQVCLLKIREKMFDTYSYWCTYHTGCLLNTGFTVF